MALQTIETRIRGVVPCLMCNGQSADPLNPYAKAIKQLGETSSKKRTDDWYLRMYQTQFESSLYVNENGQPYWPEDNILAMILTAAKSKRGLATLLAGGGLFVHEAHPLEYDGPKDVKGLYADSRFVLRCMAVNGSGPQKKRVVTCRPIFRQWELPLTLVYETEIVNKDEILRCLQYAGARVGLSNWRPRYGRFVVV